MDKQKLLRVGKLGLIFFLLIILLGSLPTKAQEGDAEGTTVESAMAEAASPETVQPLLYDSPPALTAEQIEKLEWAAENTNLSPEVDKSGAGEVAGPMPGTESSVTEITPDLGVPLAPGDPDIYSQTQFGAIIPDGYKSNTMGSSTDGKGEEMFYVGNWFAASSVNKGRTWKYVDPYADFPSFCCGQLVLHEESRDMFLWLRTGLTDANSENVFKLSVDVHDPFNTYYWTYTFSPESVNGAWSNQWWDGPYMQLGADYLYISFNMFNASGGWVRSVMLRFPLDALATGAGFSYNYFTDSTWFTFIPVSGANHTMYFASNWDSAAPYDSLRIWRWHEDSGSLTFWTKAIPAFTPTGRGDAHCGTPNWMARADQRVLNGARYEINNDGSVETRQTGRKILGWWWNVSEGGGFTHPYIEGAAFYEDTIGLLPGLLGRPYVYGGWCFSYPSFAPNKRGDLGGLFNYSKSPNYQIPLVAYTIADDYFHAPPGWDVREAVNSSAGASDLRWGPFQTARNYSSGATWIGGTHYIPSGSNCSNCSVPLWLGFGRERDAGSFKYSCQYFGMCLPLVYRP